MRTTKRRLSRVWDQVVQDCTEEVVTPTESSSKQLVQTSKVSSGVVESNQRRFSKQVQGLVEKWFLNSNVLHGRIIDTHTELAEYISDSLGLPVDPEELAVMHAKLKQNVRKALTPTRKIELAEEQIGMVLNAAQKDRSRIVALYEQTVDLLDNLLQELRGRAALEVEKEAARKLECLKRGEVYISNFISHNPLESKTVRSVLFQLQNQQKLLLEANLNIMGITKELTGFASTQEEKEDISRILRSKDASSEESSYLQINDLMQLLEMHTNSSLPTTTGSLETTLEKYLEEKKKGEEVEATTITIPGREA